jgi:hypothetical protein
LIVSDALKGKAKILTENALTKLSPTISPFHLLSGGESLELKSNRIHSLNRWSMMTRPADDAGGMIDGSQRVEACLSRWCNPKFGWFTEVYRVNFGWVVEYVGMGRFTHQRMPKKDIEKYTHIRISIIYIYIFINI